MADRGRELYVSGKPISSLRVVDLKLELEKRSLSKSGSKKDLLERLRLHLQLEEDREAALQDEEHVPNLSLCNETENDFIKEYLAAQQARFQVQREAKKQFEEKKRESEASAEEETTQDEDEPPILTPMKKTSPRKTLRQKRTEEDDSLPVLTKSQELQSSSSAVGGSNEDETTGDDEEPHQSRTPLARKHKLLKYVEEPAVAQPGKSSDSSFSIMDHVAKLEQKEPHRDRDPPPSSLYGEAVEASPKKKESTSKPEPRTTRALRGRSVTASKEEEQANFPRVVDVWSEKEREEELERKSLRRSSREVVISTPEKRSTKIPEEISPVKAPPALTPSPVKSPSSLTSPIVKAPPILTPSLVKTLTDKSEHLVLPEKSSRTPSAQMIVVPEKSVPEMSPDRSLAVKSTVKAPLENPATDKGLSEKMLSKKSSEKHVAEKSPEKPVAEKSPEKLVAEKSPEKLVAEKLEEKLIVEKSPEKPAAEKLPKKLVAEKSPEKLVAEKSSVKLVAEKSPEKMIDEELFVKASPEKLLREKSPLRESPEKQEPEMSPLQELPGKSMAENVSVQVSSEKTVAEKSSIKVSPEKTVCEKSIGLVLPNKPVAEKSPTKASPEKPLPEKSLVLVSPENPLPEKPVAQKSPIKGSPEKPIVEKLPTKLASEKPVPETSPLKLTSEKRESSPIKAPAAPASPVKNADELFSPNVNIPELDIKEKGISPIVPLQEQLSSDVSAPTRVVIGSEPVQPVVSKIPDVFSSDNKKQASPTSSKLVPMAIDSKVSPELRQPAEIEEKTETCAQLEEPEVEEDELQMDTNETIDDTIKVNDKEEDSKLEPYDRSKSISRSDDRGTPDSTDGQCRPLNHLEPPKLEGGRKLKIRKPEMSAAASAEPDISANGAPRKRKWGTSQLLPTKKPALVISTDSLKTIVPDAKPLSAEEVRLGSPIYLSPPKQEKDDNDVPAPSLRRVVTVDETESPPKPDVVLAAAALPEATSPARQPKASVLHVSNLVRPFTVNQLKELLARTGQLMEGKFWIDKVKSSCLVQYSNEEEAEETRAALHGIHWPTSNPKTLVVDYSTTEELENRLSGKESGIGSNSWINDQTMRTAEAVVQSVESRKESAKPVREWDLGKEPSIVEGVTTTKESEDQDHADTVSKLKEGVPAKLLDDLFRKTKTTPCIYWLPLTSAQIAEKEELRRKRLAERELRVKEAEQQRAKEFELRQKEREKQREAERERQKARDRERERERDRTRDRPRKRSRSSSQSSTSSNSSGSPDKRQKRISKSPLRKR